MTTRLSIGSRNVADWTLTEALKEAGFEKALQDGTVKVADDGHVTVRGKDGVAFEGKLVSAADLANMEAALGQIGGRSTLAQASADNQAPKVSDVLLKTRASRFENRVNERLWYGVRLTTELKEEYRMGQRFDLPLTRLPPGAGAIIAVDNPPPEVEKLRAFFEQNDGSVLAPVHPQEMSFRGIEKADAVLSGVRCASSERTLHASLPGVPDVLLKVDLAHIKHSMVYRPIEAVAARASMASTEFLLDWLEKNKKPNDTLAILPEVMAIVDKRADAATIVRSTEPYPPPENGERRWQIPLYSLSARDQDFPGEPPPVIRMLEDRPDKSQSRLEYFEEKILRPLIDSALRVHIDLCSSAQAHGQNTYLEIGSDGQPSGRILHQDLEAFWPHPDAARVTGRKEFFDEYGFVHNPDAKEASVYGTFRSYFYNENLLPLVKCYAQHFPDEAVTVRQRADAILEKLVLERRDTVEQLKTGPLKGFYDSYVSGS